MKNLLKIIGITALITVLGFSMITCAEEKEEPVAGKLIITGFDFPERSFVWADATTEKGAYLVAAASHSTSTMTLGEVKYNRVVLSVYELVAGTPKAYTGNDKEVTFRVYVYSDDPFATGPTAVLPRPDSEFEITTSFEKGGVSTAGYPDEEEGDEGEGEPTPDPDSDLT